MRTSKAQRPGRSGLTTKQRLFCLEYLANGNNATKAACAAGYSPKAAAQQGSENLRKPEIAAWLEQRLAKRAAALELTAERLDQELARVALVDPRRLFDEKGHLIPVPELAEDVARAIRSIKVREEFTGRGEDRKAVAQVTEIRLEPKVEALRLAYERRELIALDLRLTALEKPLGDPT